MNLELSHIEATKPRAVIANAYRLACVIKNILEQIVMDLIVVAEQFKFKFPSWFERWAETNHTGTVYNHGTYIKIKILVGIPIQFIRHSKTVMIDAIRLHKHSSLEQIFVRLAALALDFEVDRSLDKRAFKVAGWLKDTFLTINVEVFPPLLSVVNRAGGFLCALAKIIEIGHGESMLKQRRNTLDNGTYGIHVKLLNKDPLPWFPIFLSQKSALTKQRVYDGNKKSANFRDTMIISYSKSPHKGGFAVAQSLEQLLRKSFTE